MASVEKRVRNGRVAWLARWRDSSVRQRKRTFQRKVDAERHLVSVESSMLGGTYVDAALSRVTVWQWSAQWLAGQAPAQALDPRTVRGPAAGSGPPDLAAGATVVRDARERGDVGGSSVVERPDGLDGSAGSPGPVARAGPRRPGRQPAQEPSGRGAASASEKVGEAQTEP